MWPVYDPGHEFVDGWHIGCICEHLEAVTRLQINNLIINIPPRHGKSMASGVAWFTWGWAREPHLRWMYNSYADSLVVRDADKSRDIINSGWYQRRWGHKFGWGRHTAVTWYDNTVGGYRMSTTVGGKATGHGADIIVADDPMKALDARSAAERLRVINWWTGTMSTRINDPKKVRKVIIMQRLHEADLTGFLANRGGNYEMLVLPAEYEPKRFFFIRPLVVPRDSIIATSLQRERPHLLDPRKDEGELLWRERFGPKEIADLKIELDTGVAGQLQQRPSPADGTIFQRSHFRYCEMADTALGTSFILKQPNGRDSKRVQVAKCRFYQCIDTAMKTKQTNDPTAVGTFAVTPDGDLIVFHMFADRIELPYQLAFLKAIRQGPAGWSKADRRIIQDRKARWPRPLVGQWVEDASSGTVWLTSALAEGIVFRALKTGSSDKVMRSAPLSALYEAGRVYHMVGGNWLTGYEDELATFPASANDDRCLVAGTVVTTRRGQVPIELVTTDDRVMTRKGWRRVLWSGQTAANDAVLRVTLSDGRTVTGTAAHPVWVGGRGWVRIDSLAYGDIVSVCPNASKLSSSAAECTGDTRTPSTRITGSITSVMTAGRKRRDSYTVISGRRRTDRFRAVATSTTKTATPTTTTSEISSASRATSTSDYIRSKATAAPKPCAPISTEYDRSPRHGTPRMRAGNFTLPTAERPLQLAGRTLTKNLVRRVELNTQPCILSRGFARRNALPSTAAIPGSITPPVNAKSAAANSSSTVTQKPGSAPHVVSVEPAGRADVYNLEVDGEHEFYANGVLTHNCDCAAYAAQVALYDAIIRAGMAGLEEVAEQYAPDYDPLNPDPARRPWSLDSYEVLGDLPEPAIVVSLGDDGARVESHDHGTATGLTGPDPLTPPPVEDVPAGDWDAVFDQFDPPKPAAPKQPVNDPLSLD